MSSPRPFVAAVAGIATLCALDAVVKELTRSYSVAYAVLGRYVFGTVFALAVWWWQGRPKLTRDMLPAHLTRGVLIATPPTCSSFRSPGSAWPRRSPSRSSPRS